MPKKARPQVTEVALVEAATQVCYEWRSLVELATSLDEVIGARSSADTNAMEALLVHYRCMVNFLCGGYTGRWDPWDIQPSDFLGAAWWPPDSELDRRLRGRLVVINSELQHLSWERVLGTEPVMWSTVLLAHEVTYTASLFHDALVKDAPGEVCNIFGSELHMAIERLPTLGQRSGTVVTPAPARGAGR